MSELIEIVRRFNRSYTQRIGVLSESWLGAGMPLGPARLVFEVGAAGATTRELRERLGLDSGYLSRLLRGLEADGLVRTEPEATDRRVKRVTLTAAGLRLRGELDSRSDAQAERLLDPLSSRQRARLGEALDQAERLVRAATIRLEPVDPDSPAAREAVGRYFAELDRRFDEGFDATEALALSAVDAQELRAPRGGFLVALSDGRPVACGGVRALPDGAAEVKRMWVDDEWRGLGLGSRMLRALEDLARELGYDAVRLDTNGTLVEAVAMYHRAGYRSIPRYNDNPHAEHWFEKGLDG